MQTELFSEIFPIFESVDDETLGWFLSVADEDDYAADRSVIVDETWGNAVYFILSGWVKVRYLRDRDPHEPVIIDILGQGGFFGETAILGESPRNMDVVTCTSVRLLSVPAQRFIQALFKDIQLQHRMLQLTVKRLQQNNQRLQLLQEPPNVRVANILINLAENYGTSTDAGLEIFNLPIEDIADLANVEEEEASKAIERLKDKGWLQIDPKAQILNLPNPKQIAQLALGR
ncbi:Crp/Fnr family transcriptional regulator [Pseudanabaena sp. PCC 6802]|uniref:Crp/Fnr family transcriptional regulator n=1 Tax=Pseudanabaena sp. PCC 6802 TaxID=118173 RepID=UPI00034C82FE|nr:Crp/Fnr family transcriptional regulator [Pseudanabaena sp. PCC 6802]